MNEIEIIHDNKEWIVVNKPTGLSVHNNEDDTNLVKMLEIQGYKDFSPVNRLDKETSGIMILSCESEMSAQLQKALTSDKTTKSYLAIVKGKFPEDNMQGTWTHELTNKAEGRLNPLGIKKDRVSCKTNYKVLNTNKYLSTLLLTLETGRQHQIRKHCIHAKHQIIGDTRYGDKKFNTLMKKKYSFNNMALHSHKLEFKLGKREYRYESQPPESWKMLEKSE